MRWGQVSLSWGMAGSAPWAIPGVGNQEVPCLPCQSCAMVWMAAASLFLIFVFSQVTTERSHEVTASLCGGHSWHSSSHSHPSLGSPW